MWREKKEKKKEGSSKNAEPPGTGHICSDAECVGQLELQVVIKKKKEEKPEGWKFSWLTSSLEKWAYSWTRANRGNLIYKNCDIFVFSVSPFFHLWRVTAGHKYLYFFFFFFTCFSLSLSLSGCESFLPCSSLILLDKKKKNVCEHIVIISVAFWMSVAL